MYARMHVRKYQNALEKYATTEYHYKQKETGKKEASQVQPPQCLESNSCRSVRSASTRR